MTKTALITGITGQDGSLLGEYLLGFGYKVYGLIRGQNNPKAQWVKTLLPDVNLIQGDLLDQMSIIRAIETSKPDEIYNFAALSSIPMGWVETDLMLSVNTLGLLKLIEAARVCKLNTKIFQAGSTEIFGHENASPITETSLINPESPYAIAKFSAYNLCRIYRHEYDMFISCAISANHESFRRGTEFVTKKICRAAAEIKLGLKDRLVLGNISTYRDWGWAPDFVKYYHKMLQMDVADDYIIATGECHTVKDMVALAFDTVGLNWEKYVSYPSDNTNVSTGRIPIIFDNTKARNKLGFMVETPFEKWVPALVRNELQELQ